MVNGKIHDAISNHTDEYDEIPLKKLQSGSFRTFLNGGWNYLHKQSIHWSG